MTSEQLKQKERKLKVSYNRFLFGMILVLIITFSFKQIHNPTKTYSVSKSKEDWQAALRYIENAKYIMQRSTLPGNEITNWSDSLSRLEGDIQFQVSQQIAADTAKPKSK